MELLVCVKQVPDDAVSVTLSESGMPKLDDIAPVVNAFDTYALEMAARFKEANGGAVTVLSVGGDELIPSLRSCLAVGADHACKISVNEKGDCAGTAYLLAQAAKNIDPQQPFDIIFCGSESTDTADTQIGARLAEISGLPLVTNVLELELKDNILSVKQETEDGYRIVEVSVPCVVTVVKPNYEPRYPSIKSKMAARKMPIASLACDDIKADASVCDSKSAKVQRIAVAAPSKRQSGIKIQEKAASDAVCKAMDMLVQQKLV